jgi:hypothetical protein
MKMNHNLLIIACGGGDHRTPRYATVQISVLGQSKSSVDLAVLMANLPDPWRSTL